MAEPIPLRNIWVLFLYAADLVEYRDRFDNQVEAARDLPDMVARVLTHVVEERLRRNLSRGYRPQAEILSRVRGRIDMLATSTGSLMERGRVACRFEEQTMDTMRNRLVRAALDRLGTRVADDLVAHRCRQLSGDFSRMGVIGVRPSRAEMAQDQIGRNECADRFMVALAGMVFDSLILSEDAGPTRGAQADPTDHLVRRLFEKAVGNALRLTLHPLGWKVVQGRRLSWPAREMTAGMADILPGMQTDIELTQPAIRRRIVIDTKFTAILTSSNYRDQILKSGYLYQLYTYLRSQERPDDPDALTTEGLLLHPQIGGAVDEAMSMQGHRMRFKTIDLTAPASEFEAGLRGVIG
ncbi:MAG: 5-methylcytosine-specific restriction endonuclease system specificity protein McrC [Paracoccaceae bacterium]